MPEAAGPLRSSAAGGTQPAARPRPRSAALRSLRGRLRGRGARRGSAERRRYFICPLRNPTPTAPNCFPDLGLSITGTNQPARARRAPRQPERGGGGGDTH